MSIALLPPAVIESNGGPPSDTCCVILRGDSRVSERHLTPSGRADTICAAFKTTTAARLGQRQSLGRVFAPGGPSHYGQKQMPLAAYKVRSSPAECVRAGAIDWPPAAWLANLANPLARRPSSSGLRTLCLSAGPLIVVSKAASHAGELAASYAMSAISASHPRPAAR
jgi:hypothetical protein